MTFWVGLIIGIVIGSFSTVLAIGLWVMAKDGK